jgi:protein ImuA
MSSTLVPDTACADMSALAAVRSHRWQPGLAQQGRFSRHSEIFASGREGSGAGLALSLALDELSSQAIGEGAELEDRRAILWVQDRAAARLSGRPYRPGLPRAVRHRLIHVLADKPQDLLFALEEGLRCREIACVIGELAGNPRALDFTASRRLSLAAEKHGSALWLVRLDAARELSSARLRWEVTSAPSPTPEWNRQAPGTPNWQAELFRARSHPPGQWILHDDGTGLVASRPHGSGEGHAAAANPFHLVRASRDRPLAAG